MAKNNAMGVSDELIQMLAQADKQRGFPQGTMFSVMQQESGGKAQFLQDPSAYHYGLNAEGKRVAGHTGKVSTAFGPFGILESTGRDPGYGVQPLQNKSLDEQVRFASDYLAARSKQAGGLEAGLSGYGEGGKYGAQVMARLGKQAPVQTAQASIALPTTPDIPQDQVAQVMPVQQAAPVPIPEAPLPEAAFVPMQMAKAKEMEDLNKAMPSKVDPVALAYAGGPQPQMKNVNIDFNMFKSLMGRA